MSGFDEGRRDFRSEAKPVEAGEGYGVKISEISRRGDGVAMIECFVIFVRGAKLSKEFPLIVTSLQTHVYFPLVGFLLPRLEFGMNLYLQHKSSLFAWLIAR